MGIEPGEYTYLPIERVRFGPGIIKHLSEELDRLGSKRPFLVTGRTIKTKTGLVTAVEEASGRRLVGVFGEIQQHAPLGPMRKAVVAARESKADSLISLGGGSPIDSTKVIVKMLSEDFDKPILPHLAIPTTLSAAEFTHIAGMTDERKKRKMGVRDARLVPRIVFLDPELTVPTPSWLWASTGIRALDHAVESVLSPKHQPYVDVLALKAITLLFENLERSSRDPPDLEYRLKCQFAAWMSFAGASSVGTGLSHAIGRVIGARWDIPHGVTSCITLAEVMRLEARKNPERLVPIAEAEGVNIDGLTKEQLALAAAERIQELLGKLELTHRLSEYGIAKGDLDAIAREATGNEDIKEALHVLENVL